jgi:hypothetical protein
MGDWREGRDRRREENERDREFLRRKAQEKADAQKQAQLESEAAEQRMAEHSDATFESEFKDIFGASVKDVQRDFGNAEKEVLDPVVERIMGDMAKAKTPRQKRNALKKLKSNKSRVKKAHKTAKKNKKKKGWFW